MSYKAYVAYKVKPRVARDPAKFWQWTRDTMNRGEEEVKKVLRGLYASMAEGIQPDNERYQESLKYKDDYQARLSAAETEIRKGYRETQGRSERDVFDFDVALTIHEYQGGLYILPYCDMLMRGALDFLKRDPRLEDFSYWDNTDAPRGMRRGAGYRRWRGRRKVWDAIDTQGWKHFMTIDICNYRKFYLLDPWLDLMRKYSRKKKRAKSATAQPV